MILTNEQREQLREAAKPLVKFLCENFHPHVLVVVDPTRVELVEGVAMLTINEFVKD